MARAPINYILDVQSPVDRAMRGYRFGLGEVQAEREEERAQQRFGMEQERFGMEQERFRTQQAAAAQAAAAQRSEAERKQAFYNDFSRVVRGELPRSELLATYPDFADTMKQTFEMIPDQVAQNRVVSGQRIQAALRNNRPDIADNLLATEAEAARNSGNQAYADQLEEMRRQIEQSPRLVFEQIGIALDAFDAEGLEWGGAAETTAFQTLDQRARAAGLTPGTQAYQNFMLEGGPQVGLSLEVTPEGAVRVSQGVGAGAAPAGGVSQVGAVPPGMALVDTPEGLRMVTIPGGPAEQAAEEEERRTEGRQTQVQRAGQTVVQDLQRALDLIPELGALASGEGVVGGVTRTGQARIPGTVANRITQFTESALSNVGLDTLQQMRENSPTGGALGQVPIQQQTRLEQVLGSLKIDQPPKVLASNIQRVMNIYTDIIYGSPAERDRAVREGRMTPEQSAEIDSFYFQLPFDERGRPISGVQPVTPSAPRGRIQYDSQGNRIK